MRRGSQPACKKQTAFLLRLADFRGAGRCPLAKTGALRQTQLPVSSTGCGRCVCPCSASPVSAAGSGSAPQSLVSPFRQNVPANRARGPGPVHSRRNISLDVSGLYAHVVQTGRIETIQSHRVCIIPLSAGYNVGRKGVFFCRPFIKFACV